MSNLREAIEAAAAANEEKERLPEATPVIAESVAADEPDSEPVVEEIEITDVVEAAESGKDETKSITEVVDDKPAEKPPVDKSVRPPAAWRAEAKKEWDALPEGVRREVQRRELDMNARLKESALDRQRVQEITQVLSPHMDRIQSMYQGNPIQAIHNMLEIERQLVSGSQQAKVELVAKMIKRFDIDLPMLDSTLSNPAGPAADIPPGLTHIERLLDQRLQPVMSFVEQQRLAQQQASQRESQEIDVTIADMADNPDYPYFEDVRNDMADIIEMNARRGVAMSLSDAYTKAVRMNDTAIAATSARSSTQAATQAALQAHQEAQRAKGAAVSVGGSPASGGGKRMPDPSNLRNVIASAMGGSSGRF